MENIISLHEKLNQIYQIAKNLHWFTRNYGNHLLFDRIADEVLSDDDSLVELFLMDEPFVALPVPAAYDSKILATDLYVVLNECINNAIALCESAKAKNIIGAAQSLLDGIQEHLIVKKNLLLNYV